MLRTERERCGKERKNLSLEILELECLRTSAGEKRIGSKNNAD